MKKTLIALAAVAATSASFAQSTVTLSGTVETGLEKRWSGDATRMTSNRNGTSNWTLSGAEDLGGGLKAVFQVSTSFNTDTGTVTSTDGLGNNGMFVGLTGGFGTLRAGRPVNTLYANVLLANGTKGVSGHDANAVLGGNAAGGAGATGKTSNASSSVYVPNAVQYHSPRFGGVQVQVEYAPSESTAAGNKAGTGLAVRYDGGPLSASFVNYRGAVASTAAANGLKAVNQFAVSYDFSVVKVLFTIRDQGGVFFRCGQFLGAGPDGACGPGSRVRLVQQQRASGRRWPHHHRWLQVQPEQAHSSLRERGTPQRCLGSRSRDRRWRQRRQVQHWLWLRSAAQLLIFCWPRASLEP